MMAKRGFEARIDGRVQGVGFRFFVRETANELGITGFVRNLPDGSLEVVAECEEGVLKEFLETLREGPRAARVTDVQVSWGPPTGLYDRFLVKP
jgi:acylphosphatase